MISRRRCRSAARPAFSINNLHIRSVGVYCVVIVQAGGDAFVLDYSVAVGAERPFPVAHDDV